MEDSYWWFVGRRKIVRSLLGEYVGNSDDRRVLDVGCGTGANLGLLQRYGSVAGSDVSGEALSFCRKRGFSNLALCPAEGLTFEDETFGLVTAFDVLEHIEEDRRALREMYRVCTVGGYILISVPAYPFLWSEHDEALCHKRRYTSKELGQKIQEAGFIIERLTYTVTLLFPAAFFFRFFQKLARFMTPKTHPKTTHIKLPRLANGFFQFLLEAESVVLKKTDLPFGLSLFCLARKR